VNFKASCAATVLNVSPTATIQFQMRTATRAAELSSASYVPLGTATSNAPFTLTKAQVDALGLPAGSNEYIQIEAVLTTFNRLKAPVIQTWGWKLYLSMILGLSVRAIAS